MDYWIVNLNGFFGFLWQLPFPLSKKINQLPPKPNSFLYVHLFSFYYPFHLQQKQNISCASFIFFNIPTSSSLFFFWSIFSFPKSSSAACGVACSSSKFDEYSYLWIFELPLAFRFWIPAVYPSPRLLLSLSFLIPLL